MTPPDTLGVCMKSWRWIRLLIHFQHHLTHTFKLKQKKKTYHQWVVGTIRPILQPFSLTCPSLSSEFVLCNRMCLPELSSGALC
jgi:hypothetical protein